MAEKNTQHDYRPDIDGLRAIAVLSVLFYHAFPSGFGAGFIGVDVFFVISGYLITRIIFVNLDARSFSFREFYLRRIRRIFPSLIVVLTSTLLLGWFILLSDEFNQLAKHVAGGTLFVSNLVLWGESGYFDNSAETKPLLHLWSLGIEEQFYIVWPIFLWLGYRLGFKFRSIGLVAALVLCISLSLNIWGVGRYPTATFFLPVTRGWELLLGALLAWYANARHRSTEALVAQGYGLSLKNYVGHWCGRFGFNFNSVLSLCGVFLLAFGFYWIDKDAPYPGYNALIPVFGAAMLILAGPDALINRYLLSTKLLVGLGLISYPLYLWHWPLMSFGSVVYLDGFPVYYAILAIGASLFLAWLTYAYIERPIRLGIWGSRNVVFVLCFGALTLAIFGFFLSKVDLSETHTADRLAIQRKGEHAIGASLAWYPGKDNWMFLGNAYDDTLAKLRLSIEPDSKKIEAVVGDFKAIASVASENGTRVALLVGPDKHTIYPEYLPDVVTPSAKRYVDRFLGELEIIPGLKVYDPTHDLLAAKNKNQYLYWATDTHWNDLGAFVAFSGLASLLGVSTPDVSFVLGPPREGDLVKISKQKNFPLHGEDNWLAVFKQKPSWFESRADLREENSFGASVVTRNMAAISGKTVWVVGDSFTEALKKYLSATFQEVHYIGHWARVLKELPVIYESSERKPDVIVVVRVERSF